MDKKVSKIPILVFQTGNWSAATFGAFIFLLLLSDPCTPPYLASMTEACLTGNRKDLNQVYRLFSLVFDAGMFFHVAPPCALFIGTIFYGMLRSKSIVEFSQGIQMLISILKTYTIQRTNW